MTPQTQTVTTQAYLPVKGVDYLLVPEVALREKNLWEAELYSQENDLTVLSSPDINRVASAVREKKPSKQFIRYARKRAELNDNDVIDAYTQLHEHIWHQYSIRAKEILMWSLSESKTLKSILIRDYRVVDKGKQNYVFDATDIQPDLRKEIDWLRQKGTRKNYGLDITDIQPDPRKSIDWPIENGGLTLEMAKLLGTSEIIYVLTNPDPKYYEGLRALVWAFWAFWDRGWPVLGSDRGPRGGGFDSGSLVGRKL